MQSITIRNLLEDDHDAVLEVAERLPDWFTPTALESGIPLALKAHRGFLAEADGIAVGFVTMDSQYGRAQLGWIGVVPEHHQQGVGEALVDAVVAVFEEVGATSLWVETVAPADAEGSPYEGTIKFYESLGFEIDTVEPGGFDDGETDKAIYRKEL